MRDASGSDRLIGITALVVAILALATAAYLLFHWQWIGTP
jgi:hypothetical protein